MTIEIKFYTKLGEVTIKEDMGVDNEVDQYVHERMRQNVETLLQIYGAPSWNEKNAKKAPEYTTESTFVRRPATQPKAQQTIQQQPPVKLATDKQKQFIHTFLGQLVPANTTCDEAAEIIRAYKIKNGWSDKK